MIIQKGKVNVFVGSVTVIVVNQSMFTKIFN
jgi:hypothetical protein